MKFRRYWSYIYVCICILWNPHKSSLVDVFTSLPRLIWLIDWNLADLLLVRGRVILKKGIPLLVSVQQGGSSFMNICTGAYGEQHNCQEALKIKECPKLLPHTHGTKTHCQCKLFAIIINQHKFLHGISTATKPRSVSQSMPQFPYHLCSLLFGWFLKMWQWVICDQAALPPSI